MKKLQNNLEINENKFKIFYKVRTENNTGRYHKVRFVMFKGDYNNDKFSNIKIYQQPSKTIHWTGRTTSISRKTDYSGIFLLEVGKLNDLQDAKKITGYSINTLKKFFKYTANRG